MGPRNSTMTPNAVLPVSSQPAVCGLGFASPRPPGTRTQKPAMPCPWVVVSPIHLSTRPTSGSGKVSDDALRQIDAFTTPGSLLRVAREKTGLSQREAADRLHLMPDYVGIIERDDYHALRSPAFARGYVRAYGRLLGLDEDYLLTLFDEMDLSEEQPARRIETRPLQLHRTGVGVVIGLAVLVFLVLAMWWWRADEGAQRVSRIEQVGILPETQQAGVER